MGIPPSKAASIHAAAASLAASTASSIASPAEKQPGRSGTTTPKADASVPSSTRIG